MKFITPMFPYPSGSGLHAGHWYNYAIVDSYCRYLRYKGEEVFQPFGFDAHGLPAENYAKKVGRDPREVTYENIENFRKQMSYMNTQYEELLITSDDWYVKETQKIFNILLKRGLAYQKFGKVDYCESCETTLAREQVKSNCCERCGTPVVQKELKQWYFKITDYAERLLQGLDKIDYPKSTVTAQRNWIGKSVGYEIDFGNFKVFTTKPETIKDVEFIAIPSKDGQNRFTGNYCINPVTKEQIGIFEADYVLEGYGTGYVMGVPNDDKRDRKFAELMNIPFTENKHLVEDLSFAVQKVNYRLHDWCVSRQRKWGCPIPNDSDTLDTFVDSSFYTIIYCLVKGIKPKPVDLYIGGNEHACMHLIYARFITMVLFDEDLIDFEEPFTKVIHQGMILNKGEKMSKSKNNVVNLDNYNSDEIRFYLMFIGHYFDGGSWSDESIKGIQRFISKTKSWLSKEGEYNLDLTKFKETIFNFTDNFKFNKVVSSFMILLNTNKDKPLSKESKEEFISLLEIYMPGIRNNFN